MNFWTTGQDLTNIIRDLWVSCLPYNALSILLDGDQMPKEMALDICMGKKKLDGDTRKGDGTLSVTDDNSESYNSCRLLSVKEIISNLEDQFISHEFNLRKRRKEVTYYKNTKITMEGLNEEIDEDYNYETMQKRLKTVLKNLEYIYPFDNKSMVDLPLDNLMQVWTDYELNQMYGEDNTLIKAELQSKAEGILAASSKYKVPQKTFNKLKNSQLQKTLSKLGIDNESLDIDKYLEKQKAEALRKEIKPENIKTSVFNSGYIDRNGNFYGCADARHASFAYEIIKSNIVESKNKDPEDAEIVLDEAGWVKISYGRLLFCESKRFNKPSKKQLDTISDFYFKRLEKGQSGIFYNDEKKDIQALFDAFGD